LQLKLVDAEDSIVTGATAKRRTYLLGDRRHRQQTSRGNQEGDAQSGTHYDDPDRILLPISRSPSNLFSKSYTHSLVASSSLNHDAIDFFFPQPYTKPLRQGGCNGR
jgi:hypothetical protein